MGEIKNGINGGFSGKAGSYVGYTLRGKYIIRGMPSKIHKKPSPKQLAARARFRLLQMWRSPLTSFFAITFKNHTHERSAQNAAHHFNAGIVKGEYPDYKIDYSAAVISSGSLPFVSDLKMAIDDDYNVDLTWKPNYGNTALNNDLIAYLVCYDQYTWLGGDLNAVERSAEKYSFKLTYPPGCKTAHIYVTILSNDRERAANSQYMGMIELT